MLHPLHYFPCILALADLLNESDIVFDENYPFKRSSFRNRTIISGARGPITLSIPIVGGRNVKSTYKQVEIDYNNNWQRDHFRSLSTAYGNSPFFQFYKNEIEQLYRNQPKFLYDWNILCLEWIFKKMKIPIRLGVAQTMTHQSLRDGLAIEYTPQNYGKVDGNTIFQYTQVFQDKTGFLPNLSILDMLFNVGPEAYEHLLNVKAKLPVKSIV